MSEVATFSDSVLRRNPAWIQLLGLCPLLAVSTTVVNALGLAFASTFVVVGSNVCISLLRKFILPEVRLAIFVLVIASFTTIATLLLEAFAFELYMKIALFVQIIVTNCMILGRAEAFASRQGVGKTLLDALGTGLGFALALVLLGMIREVLGHGTLLSGAQLLFGPNAESWQVTVTNGGLWPMASAAPGAFIVAGLLFALFQNKKSHTKTTHGNQDNP